MNTLAVHRWPGPTPAPQDGLFAILIASAPAPSAASVAVGQQRDAARRQLRQAACEALAAVLRVPVGDIDIASRPGEAPSVLLDGRASAIGISFTHEDGFSLAAINLLGPIGADILRVQDIPDWQAVARDYLGPTATAAIMAVAAADRAHAFAQSWTQREAALKCHAQQLSEWQASLPGRTISLALAADGLTGHLHIGDKNA